MTVYFFSGPIRYITTVVILRCTVTVALPSVLMTSEDGSKKNGK